MGKILLLQCLYCLLDLAILIPGYSIGTSNKMQLANRTSDNEFETKIIGGRTALPGKFPWMVSLHAENNFICSAFLISPSLVMTAAHCVTSDNVQNPPSVFHGIVGNIYRDGPETNVNFSDVTVHPNYGRGYEYDVAILKLSEPIEATDEVKPICLPKSESTYDALDGQSMGWGVTEQGQEGPSDTLQVTTLTIPPLSVCQFAYSFLAITVTDRHVCAGGINRGICFGDSGGPLVYDDNSVPVAIGVASFVSFLGCAQPMIPAVYTATSFYVDWLAESVGDVSDICFF